jgi:alkylresorcinol/alkylpyrone synthase
LCDLLAQTGIRREQITTWILHAGGRDVLTALQARLGLADTDLRWSTATLREYGNLSSASVLFTLQNALANGAPGGHWWMTSFGAGFSCHGALLTVESAPTSRGVN